MIFTKTNSGGTENVWFYDMLADGWSLDDKRQPLLDADKLGVAPKARLTVEEHANNNLPDVLSRWELREGSEISNKRTQQSFVVSKSELAANGYDLSLNRYKQIVHEHIEHTPAIELVTQIKLLENEIQNGLSDLERLLK